VQSFTARMPLLMATSASDYGEDAGVLNSVIYTVSIPYSKLHTHIHLKALFPGLTW